MRRPSFKGDTSFQERPLISPLSPSSPLRPARRAGTGFSFIEMVFALAIVGIVLGIAAPRVLRSSDRVAMGDARWRVTAAVSTARSAAVRMGRMSSLSVDAAGGAMVVQVDTTVLGGALPVELARVELWDDLRVRVAADPPVLCFDPRGVATAGAGCAERTVVVRLSRGALADSVMVSPTGRVIP